jgi:hypothetical protein
LCLTAFMYCQPFLVNLAVSLSLTPVDTPTTNDGYGLIGAAILVYVGIAVSRSFSTKNNPSTDHWYNRFLLVNINI